MMTMGLLILPLFFLCLILSNYILNKKFSIDNLLFIIKNGTKIGAIPYGMLNETDKEKVKLYFEKYLNINIDEVEKRLILLPNE